MIIDELYKNVKEKGPVCVGLDTDRSYIPTFIKNECESISDEIFQFNKKIIDKTKDNTACYKLQIAYYEKCGLEGLKAYRDTLNYLKKERLISIGDIKRGDIAKTAEAYAKAHFEGDFEADFITVNPYMGFDTLEAFFKYLETGEKGIFVLLRTSNPGADDIEGKISEDKKIYEAVGDYLEEKGQQFIGECGFSSLCAVVGGTSPKEIAEIRERYPNMFFLVPGYGAQGGKGDDARLAFNNGNGAVINSSRGIITAYKKNEAEEENFDEEAKKAVLKMREDICG